MKRKTAIILLLALLLVTPFLANNAFAQERPGAVETLLQVFVENFGFLLNPQDANVVLYIKVLMALVIILPLFAILSLIFKGHRGVAGVVSFALGMLSIMFIPNETVLTIATTYSGIATVIFYALPIVAVFFLYKFIESTVEERYKTVAYIIEMAVMIFGFYYTVSFRDVIQKIPEFEDVLGGEWITYLLFVFGFFIVYAGYKIISRSGRGSSFISRISPFKGAGGGGIPSVTGGGTPAGPTPSDVQQSAGQATDKLNELRDALENFNRDFDTNMMYAERDFAQDATKLTDLQNAMEELSENIKNFGELWKTYEEYSTSPGAVQATINDYYDRVNSRQQDIQEKLDNISSVVNGIVESFENYDTVLRNVLSNSQSVKVSYDEIAEQMRKITQEINSIEKIIDQKLANLPQGENSSDAKRDLEKAKAEIMNSREQLKEGNELIQTQTDSLFQIEAKITNSVGKIENFKNKLKDNYDNLDKTLHDNFKQKNFDKAAEEVGKIGNSIGSMQDKFSVAVVFIDDVRKREKEILDTSEKLTSQIQELMIRITGIMENWKKTL